jgi:hypothetical protein
MKMTYVLVGSLLGLVALFVLFGLVLILFAVFGTQSLPLVSKDLADLACSIIPVRCDQREQCK